LGRGGDAAAGPFVFYSIGTWSSRKGMESLVRAYLSAFTQGEPVTLVIKTGRRNLTRQRPWIWPRTTRGAVRRLQRSSRSAAEIRLVTGILPEAELAALHAQGDCYVSLPHAEGWGLGIFDAASAGKPVITTGYGGPLDYLGEDYPFLVRHRIGPARALGFERALFRPEQNWAIPDEADAAEKMRRVFRQQTEAAEMGRLLQAKILARFSAENVTAGLLQAVQAPC
jgi:glycosyltransferase involved in cell wall biosynthesis